MDKFQLRKLMIDRLMKVNSKDQLSWDNQIIKNITHFMSSISDDSYFSDFEARKWGVYRSLGNEPNLEMLWVKNNPKVNWCFPRVKDKISMGFISVKTPSHKKNWVQGPFKGLLEPSSTANDCDEVSDINHLKGCFIPALAFDKKGFRLGRGKGYYDRALENFIGIKVGVIYSIQLLNEDLPSEGHDICVDYILTEQQLIPIQKKD